MTVTSNSLVPTFVLLAAGLLVGCQDADLIKPESPAQSGSSGPPILSPSIVSVPVSVSLENLRMAAEAAVPASFGDGKPLDDFGPAVGNRLTWNLTRSPITIRGEAGKLLVATSIKGTATVSGSIKPIRGSTGRFLRNLHLQPSQPYSQTADMGVDFDAELFPELKPEWSVQPQLLAKASVREAETTIAGIFPLSFKRELQDGVDQAVNREVSNLSARVVNDPTLREQASQAWSRLCEPITAPSGGGGPDMSLRVKPIGFEATQPTIDPNFVRLELGLRAYLRLVPAASAASACPPFPPSVSIVPAVDPASTLILGAEVDYTTLNQLLEAERARQNRLQGDGVQAEIESVSIGPSGGRLLLTLEGRFSETRWFGAAARGTIYLLAKPVVDTSSQTLRFREVSIDTASRSALDAIAASLGELLSPLLERRIEDVSIDLKPELGQARTKANEALEKLRSSARGVSLDLATIDSLTVTPVWFDDAALHVGIKAQGKLAVEITKLP